MLDALIPADDPERVPEPEEVYLAFSSWAETTGRPLYPHQDEALSEILEGRHVIAATPTGSGKSMIALAAHTASLAPRGGPLGGGARLMARPPQASRRLR